MHRWGIIVLFAGVSLAVAGCPKGTTDFNQGRKAQDLHDYDAAFEYYQRALKTDPQNAEYKIKFDQARFDAAELHIKNGLKLRGRGELENAASEFQKATTIDPASVVAEQELRKAIELIDDRKRAANVASEPLPDNADAELASAAPEIKPLSRAPINLKMTNDAKIVFDTIGKLAGLTIIYDLAPKPFLWGNLRVDTFYQPVRAIGGDFGLVTPLEEEHLNLVVCDVSGHGISSALVANRIYSETITELGNRAPLADMLRRLNSLVIQNTAAQGFFFTLAVARIDRSGRTMEFAGAGHPPAMIVQPGADPRLLLSGSTILGTLPDAVDADATLNAEIEPGDRVVLYTDGLTDVFDSHGEMLEVEGVQNIVRETSLLPFSEMKQGILNRVAAWRDGPPVDDVSLVLVEVH